MFRKLDFFKFGKVAPYFGDRKLYVPGWFLHGFGSVLTGLRADYDRITKIIEITLKRHRKDI